MKIEYTDGCICSGFYADDERMIDLSEEQIKDILKRVVDKVCNKPQMSEGQKIALREAIRILVEDFPDQCECSDEPCECCGDFVYTYTMEI